METNEKDEQTRDELKHQREQNVDPDTGSQRSEGGVPADGGQPATDPAAGQAPPPDPNGP